MHQIKITYKNDLRNICHHIQSKSNILTDAPKDNQGNGSTFSPTDLVVTALGSCLLTIMGIAAKTHNINIEGSKANITKTMANNPRRIGKIAVEIDIPIELNQKEKMLLSRAAKGCPVHHSLSNNIKIDIKINFIYK